MTTDTTTQDGPEARLAALEDRLAATIQVFGGDLHTLDARLRKVEVAGAARPTPTRPIGSERTAASATQAAGGAQRGGRVARSPRSSGEPGTVSRAGAHSPANSLVDLIGGRVLAWVGGAAILLGIALFLALAISHGWIGEQARVLLAGAVSLALLSAGVWLHDHRGRTEAAVAMVGAAVAGCFATLVVASSVYHLVPGLIALAGAIAVGATASVLAVRWAGRAIAALGMLGALSAPVLVGAPEDWPTLAMLLVTASCAMWLAARQRWAWLTLATVVMCAPQWAVPVLEGQTAGEDLLMLAAFASLGLAGALAVAREQSEVPARRATATVAMVLSATVTALVGRIALGEAADVTTGAIWLGALACVHLVLGAWAPRRLAIGMHTRGVLVALGVALADVAFALSFHGIVLAVGWSASAVALTALARRPELDARTEALRDLGIGLQVFLALSRALLDAPPGALMAGDPTLAGVLSLASVAAGCLACAQLTERSHAAVRAALVATGLTAIAYLTASTLHGPALSAAWASQAAALMQLGRRTSDRLASRGAGAFAVLATVYTLVAVAPPTALAGGRVDLPSAAIALAALAGLAWRAARLSELGSTRRQAASIIAGSLLLYLASLAIATLPEGQVALSALWGLAGVIALISGLRLELTRLRQAALGLLVVTIGKVFLYDLSTLTSIARVVSFLVLGMLLLAGAYVYQRLRPASPPDMRAVHPSQR